MVIKSMNKKFKKGFSLFEAFVVMLIVSIFVVLMANTVAHRPKDKVASEAHGRFECYYDKDNGKLYQQLYTEGQSTGRELVKTNNLSLCENKIGSDGKPVLDSSGKIVQVEKKYTACEFIPPSYAKYLIIDAVGGGAGGSASGGAEAGQFVSTFYATIERKYYVIPGKGGKKATSTKGAENGGETIVYSVSNEKSACNSSEMSKGAIVVASGGKALASLENTTINDVIACSITEWPTNEQFNCHITPSCEVVEGKVQVSFCRSKGSYVTVPLTYKGYVPYSNPQKVELGNPRYIVNNVYTTKKNANTWVYHDISQWSDYNQKDKDPTASYKAQRGATWSPTVTDKWVPSLYTLELLMNTNASDTDYSESNLHRIVNSLHYDTKMLEAHVGRGAKKNTNGAPGGVLFLW